LAKYGVAFLIDCGIQFLIALVYQNSILTLRIDERNQKLAAATKNWLLQPIKDTMPHRPI